MKEDTAQGCKGGAAVGGQAAPESSLILSPGIQGNYRANTTT